MRDWFLLCGVLTEKNRMSHSGNATKPGNKRQKMTQMLRSISMTFSKLKSLPLSGAGDIGKALGEKIP